MATPNYGYEKRQRELAKKRKAEEKKQKKLHGGPSGPGDAGSHEAPTESPATPEAPPPAAS